MRSTILVINFHLPLQELEMSEGLDFVWSVNKFDTESELLTKKTNERDMSK